MGRFKGASSRISFEKDSFFYDSRMMCPLYLNKKAVARIFDALK
jgi:hypothetical protein